MQQRQNQSHRLEKVGEMYRNEISAMLITDLDDAALQGVTILHVKLTPDMRSARVYFGVEGGEARQKEVIRAFVSSKPLLKRELARRINIKHTPDLVFYYDEGDELTRNVADLFAQLDSEKHQKA